MVRWLLTLAALTCACTPKDSSDDTGKVDIDLPPTEYWTDPVVDAVRAQPEGWDVRRGEIRFMFQSDCPDAIDTLGSCFGNHPWSPYGFFFFEEDAPVIIEEPMGVYQLEDDEAILFVGHTPPEARYFSFGHYVYSRFWNPGERSIPLASTHEFLNHALIKTQGESQHEPGSPFQDYTVVLLTGNRSTANTITEWLTPVLGENGLNPDIINIWALPLLDEADAAATREDPSYRGVYVNRYRTGYGPEDDTFNTCLRVVGPTDLDHPYFRDPKQINAAVFKISVDGSKAYDPFPYPYVPPPAQSAYREAEPVRESLNYIVAALEEKITAEDPTLAIQRDVADVVRLNGQRCLPTQGRCNGNNDDAAYSNTPKFLMSALDDPDPGIYVVGIIHNDLPAFNELAFPVAFTSVSVRNNPWRMGTVTVPDTTLRGSIAHFFPEGIEELHEFAAEPVANWPFYIHKFARVCEPNNPHCTELTTDELNVPAEHDFQIAERAYLNLITKTGPDDEAIIPPRSLAVGHSITVRNGIYVLE